MKSLIALVLSLMLFTTATANAARDPRYVDTPYGNHPKVLIEFYFNDPNDINSALFWLRTYMNTMMEEPYNVSSYDMDIKVLIHGTELVTLAKKNYSKYKAAVDRMRYYVDLGVEFRTCAPAMRDFGYQPKDLYDFVKIAPSAMTEIVHWQQQGYALMRPIVLEKKYSIEEIR